MASDPHGMKSSGQYIFPDLGQCGDDLDMIVLFSLPFLLLFLIESDTL
jgi:hypothetical protein